MKIMGFGFFYQTKLCRRNQNSGFGEEEPWVRRSLQESHQRHISILHPQQGCQTHSHRGPHQPCGGLQKAEIILGLHKCNYSLTVKELKSHSTLWRPPQSWCGPRWKWVWHTDLKHYWQTLPLLLRKLLLPENVISLTSAATSQYHTVKSDHLKYAWR